MHRFFTDDAGVANGSAHLEASDARHALKVLRLAKGDEVVLMDGRRLYQAVIADTAGEMVRCDVTRELPSPEPGLRVTLYQGLPKADKLEWIVQKCTEAGVAQIVPVSLSRCVSQIAGGKDAQKKQERWQRIAREAAKQSGRAVVPAVALPLSFETMLARLSSHKLVLVPWEEAQGRGPAAIYKNHAGALDIAVIIGPEGGICSAEIERLKATGAVPITLGKRIFRTETAGLAAAIALFALWGDME